MNEYQANKLLQQYIDGWKENNLRKILSSLSENCIVVESHGPTYCRISDIKKWFELWLEAHSKILKWNVKAFAYCENQVKAFCEWDFACISDRKQFEFSGISVVEFVGEKIGVIREYRMNKAAFNWDRNRLVSE